MSHKETIYVPVLVGEVEAVLSITWDGEECFEIALDGDPVCAGSWQENLAIAFDRALAIWPGPQPEEATE